MPEVGKTQTLVMGPGWCSLSSGQTLTSWLWMVAGGAVIERLPLTLVHYVKDRRAQVCGVPEDSAGHFCRSFLDKMETWPEFVSHSTHSVDSSSVKGTPL